MTVDEKTEERRMSVVRRWTWKGPRYEVRCCLCGALSPVRKTTLVGQMCGLLDEGWAPAGMPIALEKAKCSDCQLDPFGIRPGGQ